MDPGDGTEAPGGNYTKSPSAMRIATHWPGISIPFYRTASERSCRSELTEKSINITLDHLFHHAWLQGATALTGRIEPSFISELRIRKAQFEHRDRWVLVHSKRFGAPRGHSQG